MINEALHLPHEVVRPKLLYGLSPLACLGIEPLTAALAGPQLACGLTWYRTSLSFSRDRSASLTSGWGAKLTSCLHAHVQIVSNAIHDNKWRCSERSCASAGYGRERGRGKPLTSVPAEAA